MYAEREWRRDAPGPSSATALRDADGTDGERRAAVGETVVYDFAATVARAADADQVRRALAATVRWASGDAPVALTVDEGDDEPSPLAIPIQAIGGGDWGRIRLGRPGDEGPPWNSTVVRRLEAVAAIAALAFDRLERQKPEPRPTAAESDRPAPPAVHDATLLSAVLPFALAQARRHEEPLSVLFVAIDQLRGLRNLLGSDEADRVVSRVGARIAGLLRSSDLVGRLDDDRLVAILPRAELADAIRIGAKLTRKVAAQPDLSGLPIAVTISIGAAETPTSAETLGGLLDAADAALSETRRRPAS